MKIALFKGYEEKVTPNIYPETYGNPFETIKGRNHLATWLEKNVTKYKNVREIRNDEICMFENEPGTYYFKYTHHVVSNDPSTKSFSFEKLGGIKVEDVNTNRLWTVNKYNESVEYFGNFDKSCNYVEKL